jgi:uncharacterized membrane protein (DUF106 family)
MKVGNILWLFFMLSFILILFYSPSPFMMMGLIIGVILGIDLQILQDLSGD